MKLHRPAIAIVLSAVTGLLAGCALSPRPPLTSEAQIDLPRFMGSWYVIANIPYFAERGKVATRDEYRLREDGRIENVYVFQRDFDRPVRTWSGISTVVPGTANTHWRVRFFWPLTADMLVLAVDRDYQWALIGHPKRRYAWVFSRTPDMDEVLYATLRERFRRWGYDPEDILRVPQRPEQVGQSGFQ